MSISTATAIIDLKALKHNFSAIQKKAPGSKILAVLKANAYGHGLERVAKALPQADAFGVARIDEALALRAGGVVKPIVLLEGFFNSDDLDILAVNNIQTVIHNREQLEAICNLKLARPVKTWLKIDTGMHRLGIAPEEFKEFYQRLKQSDNVQQGIVLMSHLGCADERANPATPKQLSLFGRIISDIECEASVANSAGICAWPESHYQWVRPGLLMYGVSPMSETDQEYVPKIKPVMTLQSSVIAVRKLTAGEPVGYGGAWVSPKDTHIGVVAVGYGDGYPRHAQNGTPVLINGKRYPLAGRVSMDMITVDLGDDAKVSVGDTATLWGQSLPVEEIASWSTTIPYELLCNITRRVQITLA